MFAESPPQQSSGYRGSQSICKNGTMRLQCPTLTMNNTEQSWPIACRQLNEPVSNTHRVFWSMKFFKVFIQIFCKQKNGWNSNEGEKNILGHHGWTNSMWVASCSGRGWYSTSQLHPIICPCPHYLLEILHSLSIHLVCKNSSQSFL